MKTEYDIIIGLEIHIQSKTDSKMFCSCSASYFQEEPNTKTCPTCLGLPGALPVANRKAIELCIKTALALSCSINKETKFDRKNYFYPDLPKGFQISQYDQPIGVNGSLEIETKDGYKTIRITRVHQEEDTGKSIHANGKSYLDFNKSGVPLIEVVTEPDFSSKEEVVSFAKRLRQIVRYLDISNADMERGEMRFEVNMSLRKKGEKELPKYKVEVKNISSISVLEKVIDAELERQTDILDDGNTPKQETRGLVDMTGVTISQRSKEAEAGYRYFPEPDIPLIEISQEQIESISETLVELPTQKKKRYVSELGIDPDIAESIISDVDRYRSFEEAIEGKKSDIPEFAKWYVSEYYALDQEKRNSGFKVEWIFEIISAISKGLITRTNGKDILLKSFIEGISPTKIISEGDFGVVRDTLEIEKVVDKVLKDNPKAVSDFNKNPNALMYIVGLVMREMKGKADVNIIKDILSKKLK